MQILSSLITILTGTIVSAGPSSSSSAQRDTSSSGSHHQLVKRCSPIYDPLYQNGYLPPAPCWQEFNTACQPYIRRNTEMLVSANHSTVVVVGVDEYCFDIIWEELERMKDGRKTYGWNVTHGDLARAGLTSTLVIYNMTPQNLHRYQNLSYQSTP